MSIIPSYARFESNGLELVVNTSTSQAYATISAISRMLDISKSTVSEAVRQFDTLEAEIVTAGGLQGVRLASADVVFKLALKYNIGLAEKMGALGANLYLLNLAGYKTKVVEANVEEQRQTLEKQIRPEPSTQNRLDAVKILKAGGHPKSYIQRLTLQMAKATCPGIEAPQPSELISLPTTRALLTPTEIAVELKLFFSTGKGDGSQINKLLEQLGYQTKIAGRWSATDKAIEANLVDRKPVETNSRTQKDQLLWSADIITILKEYAVVA